MQLVFCSLRNIYAVFNILKRDDYDKILYTNTFSNTQHATSKTDGCKLILPKFFREGDKHNFIPDVIND